MNEQSFTIYFEGLELDDAALDRFYEGGCNDAIFGVRNGVAFAEFEREADNLVDAVSSAVGALSSVDTSVRIVGFEAADPVTQSGIAERAGITREAVRLFASGMRGPGDFPEPVQFAGRSPLYSWAEAHKWLAERGLEGREARDFDSELALEITNHLLQIMRLRRHWTERTPMLLETLSTPLFGMSVLNVLEGVERELDHALSSESKE